MKRTIFPIEIKNYKISFDKLLKLTSPYPRVAGALIRLYIFYLDTSQWQNTNCIYCTNKYASKGLQWDIKKLHSLRKILCKIGLIKPIVRRKKNCKIQSHYLYVKNILNVVSSAPIFHAVEKAPSNAYNSQFNITYNSKSWIWPSKKSFLSLFPRDWLRHKSFKEAAEDYYDHRIQKSKKNFTANAAKRVANKLIKCRSCSASSDALNNSVENGWTGVFPKVDNDELGKEVKQSPKQILSNHFNSNAHEWEMKCFIPATELLEPEGKSELKQIALNLIKIHQHITDNQLRPTFNEIPERGDLYYNQYKTWEVIPNAVEVVMKYLEWVDDQSWITNKSPKLLNPNHKIFKHFIKDWQSSEGYNIYTGASYRG